MVFSGGVVLLGAFSLRMMRCMSAFVLASSSVAPAPSFSDLQRE